MFFQVYSFLLINLIYAYVPTETVRLIRSDFPLADKLAFITNRYVSPKSDIALQSTTKIWAMKLPIENPSIERPNRTVYNSNQGYYEITKNITAETWYIACFEQEIRLADDSDSNFYSFCGSIDTPKKYFQPTGSFISKPLIRPSDQRSEVLINVSVVVDFPVELIIDYPPSPSTLNLVNLWHMSKGGTSMHPFVNETHPITFQYVLPKSKKAAQQVCIYSRPVLNQFYLMMKVNRPVHVGYNEKCFPVPVPENGFMSGASSLGHYSGTMKFQPKQPVFIRV